MIESLGTFFQIAIPAGAGIYSLSIKDREGTGFLLTTVILNQIAIETLKKIIPSTRPNGLHGSFPSGHTTAAFSGAFYLIMRYGFRKMPIAIALATIGSLGVGLSRIVTRWHWPVDVVGGIFLSFLTSFIIKKQENH
ncbi:MAG: hypothetical protein Tsb0021_03860 [Chlamydiales bacterium]